MRVDSQHRELKHQPASLVRSVRTGLALSASTRHIYKWTAGMRIKARQDIMLTFSAKTSDAENELWHTQYTLRTDNVLKVASATDIVHPAQLTASQTWRQGSNTWPALEPDATFFTSDAGDTFLRLVGLYGAIFTVYGASGRAGERPGGRVGPSDLHVVYARTRVNWLLDQLEL